jgi:hypothetical protein
VIARAEPRDEVFMALSLTMVPIERRCRIATMRLVTL